MEFRFLVYLCFIKQRNELCVGKNHLTNPKITNINRWEDRQIKNKQIGGIQLVLLKTITTSTVVKTDNVV